MLIPFDNQNTVVSDVIPDPTAWMSWLPPAPVPSGTAEAARMLKEAKRPMIVVGSGVHNARAWDELLALAEAGGTPIATTSAGKGAFPERHRLSIGCIGRAGIGHEVTRRCDTGGWTLFDIPGRTRQHQTRRTGCLFLTACS